MQTLGTRGKWLKEVYTITGIGPQGEYLFPYWSEKEAKRLKLWRGDACTEPVKLFRDTPLFLTPKTAMTSFL